MSSVTNRQRVRKFCAIAFVILAVASNARAQGHWEKIVDAANREGEVSLYGSDDFESLFREFHKKYPKISVKGYFGRGRDAALRIISERRADKYLADLYVNGMTTAYSMLYKGKIADPIADALVLPEVLDHSKWWRGRHHYVDPEQRYLFIFNGQARVDIAYNTKLVDPRQIKSYWDLLDPKWKGKIVVMDPRAGGYGRSGARFIYYNQLLGQEYLKRLLSSMNITLSRDYRQAIDWLAQRQFSFNLFGNGGDVLEARAKGLPVNVLDTADWKEGAGLDPSAYTFVLLDKPAHPNAAKVLVNWLLSREGQMAIQRDEQTNDSLRIDIPKGDLAPTVRRRDGARYVVTWTPEWMDMEPIQKLVNQALGEAKKK